MLRNASRTLFSFISNESKEMVEMLDKVLELIEQCKLLAAKKIYGEFLSMKNSRPVDEAVEVKFREAKEKIEEMIKRSAEVEEALSAWDVSAAGNDWTLGSVSFGISTHYKTTADGLVTMRMESVDEVLPLFEQLAVIREVDLFHKWVPFCNKSLLIKQFGHADLVTYFNISVPLMSRDASMAAFGADCLDEKGLILLIGKSCDELEGVHIPFEAKSWFHDRLDIKDFKTLIQVVSPTEAKTTMITTMDLKINNVPQSALNFVIRNVSGMLLLMLQQQAKKISLNPKCKHATRIRDNKDFYEGWVLKKLRLIKYLIVFEVVALFVNIISMVVF